MHKLSIYCTIVINFVLLAESANSALINTYTGGGPAYTSNIVTTRSSHYAGAGVNGLNTDDLVNGFGFTTGGTPPNFIDADLDLVPEHYWFDQLGDALWLSNGNATGSEWVSFDLGATFLLEKMRVWNYNQNGSSVPAYDNRSVATANIWYSTSVSPGLPVGVHANPALSGWTQLGSGPIGFQNPTGSSFDTIDDVLFPTTKFGGIYARHVLIDIITNHGGDAYVGLAEVQFFDTVAVPEPSTFALLGLGTIGLAISRRRRRAAV